MPFFNKVPIDLFLVMCYDEPEEIHFLVRLEEWYEQESETNRSYTLAVAVLMAIAFVMRELIVDRDYQPHYVSGGALPISEEQMRKSAEGTVDLGDSLLNSASIRGGHVMWQDDITRLNDLRTRLRDTQEQLGEENTLLQAELELKENKAKADE